MPACFSSSITAFSGLSSPIYQRQILFLKFSQSSSVISRNWYGSGRLDMLIDSQQVSWKEFGENRRFDEMLEQFKNLQRKRAFVSSNRPGREGTATYINIFLPALLTFKGVDHFSYDWLLIESYWDLLLLIPQHMHRNFT